MQLAKSVPIVITEDLSRVREFYTSRLGFEVTFDSPGYLGLRHAQNPAIELGFMQPEAGQKCFSGAGLYLGLEVADVDAEYERLLACGVGIAKPPTSNPWGDRSFVVHDPVGLTLYINSPIPPAREFAQYYK